MMHIASFWPSDVSPMRANAWAKKATGSLMQHIFVYDAYGVMLAKLCFAYEGERLSQIKPYVRVVHVSDPQQYDRSWSESRWGGPCVTWCLLHVLCFLGSAPILWTISRRTDRRYVCSTSAPRVCSSVLAPAEPLGPTPCCTVPQDKEDTVRANAQ